MPAAATQLDVKNTLNPNGDRELVILRLPEQIQVNVRHFKNLHRTITGIGDKKFNEGQELRAAYERRQERRTNTEREWARLGKSPPKDWKESEDKIAKAQKDEMNALAREKIPYFGFETYDPFLDRIKPDSVVPIIPRELSLEPLKDQLELAKAAIEECKKNVSAAESLPRNKEFGMKSLREIVKTTIANGAPKVGGLWRVSDLDSRGRFAIQRNGDPIAFARMALGYQDANSNTIYAPDAIAFLAWLFPTEFEKKMIELGEKIAPKNGVTEDEKIRLVADAHEALADALRQENAILIQLERENTFVRTRRVHPAVMLEIEWDAKKIVEFEG
jgi:hypothetical protein